MQNTQRTPESQNEKTGSPRECELWVWVKSTQSNSFVPGMQNTMCATQSLSFTIWFSILGSSSWCPIWIFPDGIFKIAYAEASWPSTWSMHAQELPTESRCSIIPSLSMLLNRTMFSKTTSVASRHAKYPLGMALPGDALTHRPAPPLESIHLAPGHNSSNQIYFPCSSSFKKIFDFSL